MIISKRRTFDIFIYKKKELCRLEQPVKTYKKQQMILWFCTLMSFKALYEETSPFIILEIYHYWDNALDELLCKYHPPRG